MGRSVKAQSRMSILGPLTPDPIATALGTGYSGFDSPVGIEGLCRVAPERLEILAIQARHPGCGHLREFVRLAKMEYPCICIWFVTSDILEDCLPRYGFRKWRERQQCAGQWESVEGWRWDR